MRSFVVRTALLFLTLGPHAAGAQPVPPVPPTAAPARPAQRPATPTPTPTPVKPAPRTPVQSAPLVQPRPGTAAQRPPQRPPQRPTQGPGTKPKAPAIVPVPVPAPAPPAPAEPEKPAEPTKGSNTGQPLPRFATLRSDEVNLRTGPGTRYPIEWVYKRRDLPVQIEREFEAWRLIRDQEGVKGWVHSAVLMPRRTAVVIAAEHALRAEPRDDAPAVARLKPGVILRLRSCEANADWCQAGVQDYRGWVKRSDVWGIFPGEAIQ